MDIEAVAESVEAADAPMTDDEAAAVVRALRSARPDIAVSPRDLSSVENLLHLADRIVPGWAILLRGTAFEPDGHWRCTLRETTARDSDAYIGTGRGRSLNAAILAAILRVAPYRPTP